MLVWLGARDTRSHRGRSSDASVLHTTYTRRTIDDSTGAGLLPPGRAARASEEEVCNALRDKVLALAVVLPGALARAETALSAADQCQFDVHAVGKYSDRPFLLCPIAVALPMEPVVFYTKSGTRKSGRAWCPEMTPSPLVPCEVLRGLGSGRRRIP